METTVLTVPATAPHKVMRREATLRPAASMDAVIERACRSAALGRGDAQALAALARTHRVGPGEPVLSRDEPARSLWLVASGRVALGLRGSRGLLQQRCSVEGGQWLDAASALAHRCYAEDAVAETAAVLWELPLQAVLRAALTRPQLLSALAGVLAETVTALVDSTRGLMTKDVQARCATWLLQQAELDAERTGASSRTLQLRQRKRTIALQLGTTAETLSRTLRQMSQRGLIEVQGYEIRLLDIQALQRLAEPLQCHVHRRAAPRM